MKYQTVLLQSTPTQPPGLVIRENLVQIIQIIQWHYTFQNITEKYKPKCYFIKGLWNVGGATPKKFRVKTMLAENLEPPEFK